MASRLFFPETEAAAVSPAIQGTYLHTNTLRRRLRRTVDTSVLTSTAFTPDAADHGVAGASHIRQYVSDKLQAQSLSGTWKMQIQGLEPNANCNQSVNVMIFVCDSAGTTIKETLFAQAASASELNTALRNIAHSGSVSAATLEADDRIVVQIGCSGTPAGGGGVQGHNSTLRWGCSASSGDLPENETETGTTFRAWLEFSQTLAWADEISLAGSQPASTGALSIKYIKSLDGSQPTATGTLIPKYLKNLDGSQLAASGSLTSIPSIGLAGNQPTATGALSVKYLISLTGSQPAASGTVALFAQIALAGNQLAPSGALALKYLISLAGDQPTASGALAVKYLIALTGSQPAATGNLAVKYLIALTGTQPAASGALGFQYLIGLTGSQPAAGGSLSIKYIIALAGNQPAASGALGVQQGGGAVSLSGNQPAASGALAIKYLINVAGAQPASSGVLAILYRIVLSGSQPAPSGSISAGGGIPSINLAGNQPAPSGALSGFILTIVGHDAAATLWEILEEDLPAPSGYQKSLETAPSPSGFKKRLPSTSPSGFDGGAGNTMWHIAARQPRL